MKNETVSEWKKKPPSAVFRAKVVRDLVGVRVDSDRDEKATTRVVLEASFRETAAETDAKTPPGKDQPSSSAAADGWEEEASARLRDAASRLDMRVGSDPGGPCHALVIGDWILPYVLDGGNLAFFGDHSHDAALRPLCQVTRLGFVRVDYRVEEGSIVLDDITTNPAIPEMYARITMAFEALDTVPDALAPVPLVTHPETI